MSLDAATLQMSAQGMLGATDETCCDAGMWLQQQAVSEPGWYTTMGIGGFSNAVQFMALVVDFSKHADVDSLALETAPQLRCGDKTWAFERKGWSVWALTAPDDAIFDMAFTRWRIWQVYCPWPATFVAYVTVLGESQATARSKLDDYASAPMVHAFPRVRMAHTAKQRLALDAGVYDGKHGVLPLTQLTNFDEYAHVDRLQWTAADVGNTLWLNGKAFVTITDALCTLASALSNETLTSFKDTYQLQCGPLGLYRIRHILFAPKFEDCDPPGLPSLLVAQKGAVAASGAHCEVVAM